MFTTRPELTGTFGMVTSTHWLASAVGMRILERGGNAFDATVAGGLVLHIVEPHLNGVGGDAPIIGFDAASEKPFVICGQGVSPAAASASHFQNLGLDLVPGTGWLPAVVPGAFGAWMELLLRYGSLPLREVMEPAIHYALHGYPMVPKAIAAIETVAGHFRDHWPTSSEIYLRGGKPPKIGASFSNPVLGNTLLRLLNEGESGGNSRDTQLERARSAFYTGFVAEAIAEAVQQPVMDSSGRAHAGLITYEDLASWRAGFEEPARVDFRGYTVLKTGAWGQGPVLLQQLAQLAAIDLESMAPDSSELIHVIVENAKLAFADREAYYGDPDFKSVPLDRLLSSDYARARSLLIGDTASESFTPGSIAGYEALLPSEILNRQAASEVAGLGEPTVEPTGETRGDTCHIDVVDRYGNLAAATPSGGWLQSSPTVRELGFALPTRGQMFWLEEGLPNSLEPRKRPRTTLSPGLILRDGRPYLAFGTPGGDSQDQWTVPFLINHLVYGMNLQEAIDAPTFHSKHMPSSFFPRARTPNAVEIEARFGHEVLDELKRRGHILHVGGDWSLGRLSAAGIRADGLLFAGANPRGMQGYAVGR